VSPPASIRRTLRLEAPQIEDDTNPRRIQASSMLSAVSMLSPIRPSMAQLIVTGKGIGLPEMRVG